VGEERRGGGEGQREHEYEYLLNTWYSVEDALLQHVCVYIRPACIWVCMYSTCVHMHSTCAHMGMCVCIRLACKCKCIRLACMCVCIRLAYKWVYGVHCVQLLREGPDDVKFD
jgi:hypothetical protein